MTWDRRLGMLAWVFLACLFGALALAIQILIHFHWSPARPLQAEPGGLLLQVAQDQVFDAELTAGKVYLATADGIRTLSSELRLSEPHCVEWEVPATRMISIANSELILFVEARSTLLAFNPVNNQCRRLEFRYGDQSLSLTVNHLTTWKGSCCLLATEQGLFLARKLDRSVLEVDRLGDPEPYGFAHSHHGFILGEAHCAKRPGEPCLHVFSDISLREGSAFRHDYALRSFLFDSPVRDAAHYQGEFLIVADDEDGEGPLYLTDSDGGWVVRHEVDKGGPVTFVETDSWGTWVGTQDGVYLLFANKEYLIFDHQGGETEDFRGVGIVGETLWLYSGKKVYSTDLAAVDRKVLGHQGAPAWKPAPALDVDTSAVPPDLRFGLQLSGLLPHLNPGPMFYSQRGGVYFLVPRGTIGLHPTPLASDRAEIVLEPYYHFGSSEEFEPTTTGFSGVSGRTASEFRRALKEEGYPAIQHPGKEITDTLTLELEPKVSGARHLSIRDALGNYRTEEEWVWISYRPEFWWIRWFFWFLGFVGSVMMLISLVSYLGAKFGQ